MKHKYLLIIFLVINFIGYSQNENDIQKYQAKTISASLYDNNNKLISEKLFGKEVKIDYDKVFKSYTVTFYNEHYKLIKKKFIFISQDEDGYKKMESDTGENVIIIDTLENGGLIIQTATTKENTTLIFITSKTTKLK